MTVEEQVRPYLKKDRRDRWVLAGLAGVAIFALGVASYAVVVNFGQSTQITKIERSACAQNSASNECQTIRKEAAEDQSLEVACITLEQAGYTCPKPGSDVAEGVRPTTPNTGTSEPGPQPGGLGGSNAPGNNAPGNTDNPSPPKGPSAPATPVSESANDPEPAAEPPTPIRDALAPTLEGVQQTVCSLTPLLCP